MIRKLYPWMLLLGGVLIGLAASGRVAIRAQDRAGTAGREPGRGRPAAPAEALIPERGAATAEAARAAVGGPTPPAAAVSAQEVLLRPHRFTFSRPTPLAEVCLRLEESLGVPVVLDRAALDRQDVDPGDTVQLELQGARLKTGLKLLLDQVGLTYHIVPEDNLLIITDREGSDDPLDRIWNELRALHRDLHDVQDAVDDLADMLAGDQDNGPRVRKPTIIEEKPDRDPFAPAPPAGGRKEPKEPTRKPGAAPGSATEPRATRSRVPVAGPRHSLRFEASRHRESPTGAGE